MMTAVRGGIWGSLMPRSSKVELYAAIRRDARAGMSRREIAAKHGVGRLTIVKAMESAWPEPRKAMVPRGSRLDPFKPVIDEILRADLDAPRKQRHTSLEVCRYRPPGAV